MAHATSGRAVVLVNPESGSAPDPEELGGHFPDAEVHAVPGPDLEGTATRAVEGRAAYVGVAGGDGTVRSVAAVLAGTGVPLLPIPGGTLNHFARAVGLGDLEAAAAAARTGADRIVDLGEVNGHVFLNTASIGAYPRMVERREQHEERLPRWVAQPLATLQEIRHGHPLHVEIDGRSMRIWLVFVGNGTYGGELASLGTRESLSEGQLDVRVVSARGRWPRTRILLAALTGRLSRSAVVTSWTCQAVTIAVAGASKSPVAIDGDVEVFDAPLKFRSRAGALVVRYNQSP